MSRVHVLNAQPWRFLPGDKAYVRDWPEEDSVLILAQLLAYPWPHYLVADATGAEWRISQLELSSKPIIWR